MQSSEDHNHTLKYDLAGNGARRASRGVPIPAEASGPVVLVVDDDPAMTKLISALLEGMGVVPLAAYDGLQGMVVAQRERPVAILIDLHMPAGGGLRLIEKLRASAYTRDTPIVVVTADESPDLPSRARDLGAQGFLRKPVTPGDLASVLSPFLKVVAPASDPPCAPPAEG